MAVTLILFFIILVYCFSFCKNLVSPYKIKFNFKLKKKSFCFFTEIKKKHWTSTDYTFKQTNIINIKNCFVRVELSLYKHSARSTKASSKTLSYEYQFLWKLSLKRFLFFCFSLVRLRWPLAFYPNSFHQNKLILLQWFLQSFMVTLFF